MHFDLSQLYGQGALNGRDGAFWTMDVGIFVLRLPQPFFRLLYYLLELNFSLFPLLFTELIEGEAKIFDSNTASCVSEREEDEREK